MIPKAVESSVVQKELSPLGGLGGDGILELGLFVDIDLLD